MKKFISISFLFIAFLVAYNTGHAQISNTWTTTIKTKYLPTSATVPTLTTLGNGQKSKHSFTLYLDATTYDNATGATAFAALGAAVKTAIDSNYVEDVFGLDPTADILMHTIITHVKRGWDAFNPDDLSAQYLADEDVFRVDGYCIWIIDTP